MKEEKDGKAYGLLLYIAAGIVLSIVFGVFHRYVAISSDTTTTLPMSIDLLRGNIWLCGWTLGTNNFYFTEIVIYALGKLLGFGNITLIDWVPGIFWTIWFLATVGFLYDKKWSKTQKAVFLTGAFGIVLIVAYSAAYTLLNANSHNNLYAFLAIYLLLLKKCHETGNKGYLCSMTVLAMLLAFSESVTTMVLFVPVACLCVVSFIKKEKKFIPVFVSVIISYIGGKAIYKVFAFFGGMDTVGLPVGLTTLHGLKDRIIGWINQFCMFLGAGNYTYAPWDIEKVVITLLLLIFLAAFIYYTINIFRVDWRILILYFIAAVNIAACIFTDVVCFYRYIATGYYFGFMLSIVFIAEAFCKFKYKNYLYFSFIVLAVFFAGIKLKNITGLERANSEPKELAAFIKDNGLGDGYADFWCASVVSFYTDYENSILPVFINRDNQIRRYTELVRSDWYEQDDIHYVITYNDAKRSDFINTQMLFDICGQPFCTYIVGEYAIYYYEEDISGYCI